MLEGITIGQYVPVESPVHSLDPRFKILDSVALLTVLFLVSTCAGFGLVALYLAVVLVMARLPLGMVYRGLKPLFFLIALTVILNFFMTPGTPWHRLGPLVITREGFDRGLMMGLRLFLLVMVTSLLTLSTSPIRLTDGIERLLRPFARIGMPAHELAMMMTIALRFIPTLLEETEKIIKAQKARGADFESGNFLRRAKNMVPILVPLFLSAFRRADELATAMEARCYRGGEGRTKLHELVARPADVAVFVMTVAFSVLVGVFQ